MDEIVTLKDKIEQFKRDCKSMNYWIKCFNECTNKLEEIAVELSGVKSLDTKSVLSDNKNPYKNNKIYWFLEEEKVLKERNEYAAKIERINKMISKIPNKKEQQLIKDLYIERKNHELIANQYHYNRRNMYRHVDRIISKIV